jgi:hypothetical protein
MTGKEVLMKRSQLKKLQKKSASLVFVLFILAFSSAEAPAAPSWRGDEGTTFQQWSFSEWDCGPLEPDEGSNNAYGEPWLLVDSASQWSQSVDQHSGVWALGGEMFIDIPNFPLVQDMKEIWIELTWKGAGRTFLPDKPIIGIETDVGIDRMELFEREETSLGNGWKSTIYKYHVWPNPTKEWVTINGDIYLDQVITDTRCVPEPGALSLLGLGALFGLRRKRNV